MNDGFLLSSRNKGWLTFSVEDLNMETGIQRVTQHKETSVVCGDIMLAKKVEGESANHRGENSL